MNLLIIGYGKMGKTIESIALKRNHVIAAAVDSFEDLQKVNVIDTKIDAAFEFSQPNAAFKNIKFCLENKIPVISGTTGWSEQQNTVLEICRENQGAFFYASNFSIGVNLFFRLNQFLADLMNDQTQYVPRIIETHHTEKKDEPSGTAISIAEDLVKKIARIGNWTMEKDVDNSDLIIESKRIGKIPGTHIIEYTSEIDRIEIKHEAFGREGFALGAVLVAEWLRGRSGILTMDDFLNF